MAKQSRHIGKVAFHSVAAFFFLFCERPNVNNDCDFQIESFEEKKMLPLEGIAIRYCYNKSKKAWQRIQKKKLVFMSPHLQSKISYSEIYC